MADAVARDDREVVYRKDFNLWWPAYDHKPDACFKRVTSRVSDMKYAIGLSKRWSVVVQAGGHAGVWPMFLADWFTKVWTFEPDPALYDCLSRNVRQNRPNTDRIIATKAALGATESTVLMKTHVSAGSWRVDDRGTVPVQQITIDSLNLMACNLIVLDIEGYEVEALRGAQRTIERCRPVLHVEELNRSKNAIRAHMSAIGYRLMREIHSDAVYAHVGR